MCYSKKAPNLNLIFQIRSVTRSATPSWTLTWARTLMPKWRVVSTTADIPGRLDTDSCHLPSGLNQRRCVRLDWCFFAVKSRPGRPSTTRRWWETPSNASATTVQTKVKHRFSVHSYPSSSLSCCTDGRVMSVLSVCPGFDYKTCNILVALEQQSPDIAQGVHMDRLENDIGAGDQVLLKYLRQHSMRNNVNICVYNVCAGINVWIRHRWDGGVYAAHGGPRPQAQRQDGRTET